MSEFIEVTDGKTSDNTAARRFTFFRGSIIVCDRVVGTARNAVMTQVLIALCTYLLIAFLKFQSKAEKSMQQILRLLQINLFENENYLRSCEVTLLSIKTLIQNRLYFGKS